MRSSAASRGPDGGPHSVSRDGGRIERAPGRRIGAHACSGLREVFMAPAIAIALTALVAAQLGEMPPVFGPEVPFVPTPMDVVDEMLRLAQVGPDDVVYDLGCGDGRIVIRAAELHGARGV